MKIHSKSLLYGTLILAGANFFVRILGFAYRVFLSRMMGSEGMGLYQLVFPLYMIGITITVSGIPVAVSRLVSQRKAVGDQPGMKRILRISLALVFILSVVVSGLMLFNIEWLTTRILHEPRTRGALFILFPCITIVGIGAVLKGYFYGNQDVHPPALAEIWEQLVRMTLVLALFYVLPPLHEEEAAALAAFGMVIGELASLLYLHYCYHKSKRDAQISRKTLSGKTILKEIFAIAAPVTATRLISTLMRSANSILILQRLMASGMSGSEAVSLFGVFSGMALPLLFLPFTIVSALSVVVIPNISENVMLENWADIQNKVSKAILITTLTAFPSMALLITLGPTLGTLLYNEPLVGKFLIPLALPMIFHSLQHTLSSVLNGLGKQNRAALHFIIGGLIQMGCTYFLVADPRFGIYGYIIGFILDSIVTFLLNLITVLRSIRLKFQFVEWLIKPGFAALLMGSTIRLCNIYLKSVGFSPGWALAFSFLAGSGLFVTALLSTDTISYSDLKALTGR